MSKLLRNVAIVAAGVVLSGCSTLGQLEVLNDISPTAKRIREASAVMSSVDAIVTGRSQPSTSSANIRYGNTKQLPYHIKSGRPATVTAEILNVIQP